MNNSANRPLSPHLQVYKLPLTALLSITHRATGVALSVGTLVVVYWLTSLAAGPEAFESANGVLGSFLGKLVLFGWTWALFYHTCNGIRHMLWDVGVGLTKEGSNKSNKAVIAGSIVMTILVWLVAL